MNRQQQNKYREGNEAISGKALSSEGKLAAYNLWKAVILLQCKLRKNSKNIHDISAEDVVKWV